MYDIETNYFVFANAGSGKTTALVNRFLKLCLTGSDPEKIYCITYTNAATNEMILRINKKIDFFLQLSDNDFLNELQKIDLFHKNDEIYLLKKTLETIKFKNLKISTIDSICYTILQQQLRYNINIITQDIKDNIIEKILNSILNYQQNQEDFNKSLDYILNIFSKKFLKDIIIFSINNYNNINTIFLKHNIRKYNYLNYKYLINDKILEYEKINLNDEEYKIKSEIISSALILKKVKISKNLKALNNILENWEIEVKKKDFLQSFLEACFDKNNEHIYKSIKKIKELSELIKNIENFVNLKNNFKYLQNLIHISSIIIESINVYQKIKMNNNYYTFQDIRYETLKILQSKNHSMIEIDLKIEHILIDESQDLSESAWLIINKITEEFFYGIGSSDRIKTFFVVGDYKQSIFSFQGSDVNLLFKNYEEIKRKSEFSNIKFQKINLNISYRSSDKILNIINELHDKEFFKINMIEYPRHICYNTIDNNNKYYELINISKHSNIDKEENNNNFIKWEINNLREKKNSNDILLQMNSLDNFMILYRNENDKIGEIISKNNLSNIININFYTLDILSLLIFIINNSDSNSKFYLIHSKFNQNVKNFETMNLLTFIKSLNIINEFKNLTLYSLIKKIYLFISNTKLNQEEKDKYYINLDIILKILSKNYNIISIEDLINLIIASPKIINSSFYKEKIQATTIHSSKGLEAEEIYILDYEISAKLKKNDLLIYNNNLWIKDNNNQISSNIMEKYEKEIISEEMRILYVALTRAKNKITILSNKNNNNLWLSDFINSHHLI